MIQKKICMIGTSAVGKTSLVARFVSNLYSEKYHTTVGVKVDKKIVPVEGAEMTLMIWDLAGDDDFQRLEKSYLRGTAGYLLVADGTRAITLDQVLEIQGRVEAVLGPLPFLLALNKADLGSQWEIGEARIASLQAQGWTTIKTSAKDDLCVTEAFTELARRMHKPA